MILALLLIFGSLMLEPEGMVVRCIWNAPASAGPQRISPDGRYISYSDRELGGLALHEIATGKNHYLTKGDAYSIFSPDGKQVAYTGYKGGWYDLRVIGFDGAQPRVLYRHEETEVVYVAPVAWSPDGKHILALFSRRDKTQQIVWVSVADGSVRVLKSFEWRWPRTIHLSPDGRYIAYEFPPHTGDIYLLATDGSRETRLVENLASDFVLGWAPDGKRVLFASDRRGAWDAWLIHVADGKPQGAPELVKPYIGEIRPMGFTPNGSYYYSVATRMNDVYVATLDLATGKVVVPPAKVSQRMEGSNTSPGWSPDGEYLAYLSDQSRRPGDGRTTIRIRSTKTGQERELSPGLAYIRGTGPRWSPDGRSFIVTGWDQKGRRGIYQIDAQTGSVTAIKTGEPVLKADRTPDEKVMFLSKGHGQRRILLRDLKTGQERELIRAAGKLDFALSRDGRQVAFTMTEDGILKLASVSDGKERELFRVQEPETIQSPTWAPDSHQVLFERRGRRETTGIWRISAEGGEPQRLELAMRGLRDLRVHPDGRRVAFTASPQKRKTEVWVMENFLPPLKDSP